MYKKKMAVAAFGMLLITSISHAGTVANAGFEQDWSSWVDLDKDGKSTSLSGDAHTGEQSVKISSKNGSIAQMVDVEPNASYEVSAYVLGAGIIGVKLGEEIFYETHKKSKEWTKVSVKFNSKDVTRAALFAQYNGTKARFDDFELTKLTGDVQVAAKAVRLSTEGLSPDLAPGKNFELIDWNLSIPIDRDGDGIADEVSEPALDAGFQLKPYFYTAEDGGMVFRAPVHGPKTSKNTKYTRTELREMLRRGNTSIRRYGENGGTNKNNWVFSSTPKRIQKASAGVDGDLRVTMAVNHVTSTGIRYQQGRVIIGQIHAKKDEPLRLYYRKLPEHTRGSIYLAHEPANGDDQWYELLGERGDKAPDPEDGIALNEKFTYEVNAHGNLMTVTISIGDDDLASVDVDMTGSGYDSSDDYMYFKAGVYNQNNSGDPTDYVQATIYNIENGHFGYEH